MLIFKNMKKEMKYLHDFQKFLDENYPEKHYIIKRDLYNQINKIVSISMMSVREQINQK